MESVHQADDQPKSRRASGSSGRLRAALPFALPVAVSLAIALAVYGPHLFDLAVPIEEDVRAHVFKIDILYSYLARGSWPQWVPYWYHGFPIFQYYPPGFYLLGAGLTFLCKHAVISYKLLLLLTLASNGLATYYFSRRFLKFSLTAAMLCLVAYESSTGLMLNCLYGVGPNLLSWSISLVFLTTYLCRVHEGRTRGARDVCLPGLLLGVTLLIHPFPAIFAAIAVITFHIIRFAHGHRVLAGVRAGLAFPVAVFGTAGLLSAHYWLPFLLTRGYVSPIYTFTKDAWKGGTPFLVILTLSALAVGLILRRRAQDRLRLDLLIAYTVIAAAVGYGLGRHLPFGLGSLVHEFRFATIMAPCFEILLLAAPLNLRSAPLRKEKVAISLLVTAGLVLVVTLVTKLGLLAECMALASSMGVRISYHSLLVLLLRESLPMALMVLPIFPLLLAAMPGLASPYPSGRARTATTALVSACLILMVSVFPFVSTYQRARLDRLFSYVQNHQEPEYAQVLEAASGGRTIVPISKGYLLEGDSPVTFGWHYDVETVNGAYNQGDPKFFRHTAHLEWEERWLGCRYTRTNLMHESAAQFIFVRKGKSPLASTGGLTCRAFNIYGQLWELEQGVARAVSVTPVLLDVESPERATEFFNILLPYGYRMVFADVDEVPERLRQEFPYAMVDDESKISKYEGKTVFVLNDSGPGSPTAVNSAEGRVVRLNLPYVTYTDRFFYRGDKGDVKGWRTFDSTSSPRLDWDASATLQGVARQMAGHLDQLTYEPATYDCRQDGMHVVSVPGFTLIKDSYFPYWNGEGGELMPTTQGFILVHSDTGSISLNYGKPLANPLATVISLVSITAAGLILAIPALRSRRTRREHR